MQQNEIKTIIGDIFRDATTEVITKVVEKLKKSDEEFKSYNEMLIKDFVIRATNNLISDMPENAKLSPIYGTHLAPILSNSKMSREDSIDNIVDSLTKEITFYIKTVIKDLKLTVNRTEKELELSETKINTTSYLPRIKMLELPTFDISDEFTGDYANYTLTNDNINFVTDVDVEAILDIAKANYQKEVDYISSYSNYNLFVSAVRDIYSSVYNGGKVQHYCTKDNGALFAVIATFAKIVYKLRDVNKKFICSASDNAFNIFLIQTTKLIYSKYSLNKHIYETNVIGGCSYNDNVLYGTNLNVTEALEENDITIEDIYGELINEMLTKKSSSIISQFSAEYKLIRSDEINNPITLHNLVIHKDRNSKLYSEYRGFIIRNTNNTQRARLMGIYADIFKDIVIYTPDNKKFMITDREIREVILPYIRKHFLMNISDVSAIVQAIYVDILYSDTNFEIFFGHATDMAESNRDNVSDVPVYAITCFIYDAMSAQLEVIEE